MSALKVTAASPDDMNVEPAFCNGGLPLPSTGGGVRVVSSVHLGCGGVTEVRMPAVVPLSAVRRLTCERCAQVYRVEGLTELGAEPITAPAAEPIPELVPEPVAIATPVSVPEPAVAVQAPVVEEPNGPVPSVPPPVVSAPLAAGLAPAVRAKPARPAVSLPSVSMPSLALSAPVPPTFSMPSMPVMPALPSWPSRPTMPAFSMPSRPSLPAGATLSMPSMPSLDQIGWRWLTMPIAALAVFVVLIQARDSASPFAGIEQPTPALEQAPQAKLPTGDAKSKSESKAADGRAKRDGKPSAAIANSATLVSEATFSLALPAGWDRVTPNNGATFAAVSADGTAEATLWIQNDPRLDMATFESNSRAQLESLAGSAEVVDREAGPTVESSSVKLAPTGAPEGAPTYQVILRGSNDNWFYLSTTYQPDAPADVVDGVELIQGSFVTQGGKG